MNSMQLTILKQNKLKGKYITVNRKRECAIRKENMLSSKRERECAIRKENILSSKREYSK